MDACIFSTEIGGEIKSKASTALYKELFNQKDGLRRDTDGHKLVVEVGSMLMDEASSEEEGL